jgi:hypothetical protein
MSASALMATGRGERTIMGLLQIRP